MTANHEHTPTVDELRRIYALKVPHDQRDRRNAEFDRFLAAAEQLGAIKALRDAADIKLGNEYYEMLVEDELNTRADLIADKEGNDE